MEYVTLANGVKMPQLGYGVYQVTKEECERCVADALKAGYRHIDTAQSYFNEEEVGNALKKSGIPREELFITTKVWIEHYGYEACRESVLESLRKLQLDYLDLVLLHQPFADYYGAWRALEELYAEGKLRPLSAWAIRTASQIGTPCSGASKRSRRWAFPRNFMCMKVWGTASASARERSPRAGSTLRSAFGKGMDD